jgi:hypothetical protein
VIQSLLIANRGEIACRIIRTQILPGTGRGTAPNSFLGVVEGSDEGVRYLEALRRAESDPSVSPAAIHLPVPGRIL